jgi:hypothetical protein
MAIDTQILWRIFNNTTNSYKYLFFISLLELLKTSEFKSKKITYKELGSMMLAYAWYPKKYFRLSFGKQDQIDKFLEQLIFARKLMPIGTIYKKLLLESSLDLEILLRYVPQRLIRDFFVDELFGKKDGLVDSLIVSLSSNGVNKLSMPLYRIDQKNQVIELDDDWIFFIKSNFAPIFEWSLWNWAKYLQKHNPNIPSILNKLMPPISRESLAKQKFMWDSLIDKSIIRCIYTNEIIKKNYHLDHFLPWSFVAHNQLWNLIPTSPEINIVKSDSIPNEQYVPALAKAHHMMLLESKKVIPEKKWCQEISIYTGILNVEHVIDLLDLEKLTNRYLKTYNPLIEIATNNGFPGNWTFR